MELLAGFEAHWPSTAQREQFTEHLPMRLRTAQFNQPCPADHFIVDLRSIREVSRNISGSKGAQRGSGASGRQAYRLNTRRAGSLQEKSPAFGGAKSEEVRVAKRQACSSHITGTTNGQATAAKTTTKSIGPP